LKEKLVKSESSNIKRIGFTDINKKVIIKTTVKPTVNKSGSIGKITDADRKAVIESYRLLKKSGKIK
jgi:hypothetical protein